MNVRLLREAYGIPVSELIERMQKHGASKKLHPDTIRNVELGYKKASKLLMTQWMLALGQNPLDVWQPEPSSLSDRIAG